jgi:hypothetical protein
LQVVNAEPDGSNWGAGSWIGKTTPVPSGGSGDVTCDWSGAMPGEEPVVGGGGTVICCWASALPDSNANPSAAIADNLITMKASQIDIAIPQSLPLQIPLKEWGRRKGGTDGKRPRPLTAGASWQNGSK